MLQATSSIDRQEADLGLAELILHNQLHWVDSQFEDCDPLVICVAEALAVSFDSSAKQVFIAHQIAFAVFCVIKLGTLLYQVCLGLGR